MGGLGPRVARAQGCCGRASEVRGAVPVQRGGRHDFARDIVLEAVCGDGGRNNPTVTVSMNPRHHGVTRSSKMRGDGRWFGWDDRPVRNTWFQGNVCAEA